MGLWVCNILYISVVVAVNQAQLFRSPGSGTDAWVVYGNIVSSWAHTKSFGFALFLYISVELGSREEVRWTVGGRSVSSAGTWNWISEYADYSGSLNGNSYRSRGFANPKSQYEFST